jgi:hypothetical protein
MLCVRRIRRARVTSRHPAKARSFAERESKRWGIPVEAVSTAAEPVEGADLICTTTSAREPILEGAWIASGAHINAVGSSISSTRELDTEAILRSRLYADRRESLTNEAGDFLIPKKEGAVSEDHIVGELGEVSIGRVPGRRTPAGHHPLQVARPRGRGRRLGEAHLREGEGDRPRPVSRARGKPRRKRLKGPRSTRSARRGSVWPGSRFERRSSARISAPLPPRSG